MSPFDLLLPDWWFAAYLGSLVALPLVALLVAIVKVQGRRWRVPVYTTLPPAKVPNQMRKHSQPWVGRLGFLCFPLQECVVSEGGQTLVWRMASTAYQAVALLEGDVPKPGSKPEFRLRLISFLSDGRTIVTADGPTTPRPPAHWLLSQDRFKTIEAQITAHRSAVESAKGNAVAVLPAPEALAARLVAEDQAVFDALAASGDFTPESSDPGFLSPAFSRLPTQALRYLGSLFTGKAFASGRRRDIASVTKDKGPDAMDDGAESGPMALSLEQLVQRDIQRFRELTGDKHDNKHRGIKLGVLIATVAVCVMMFGQEEIGRIIATILTLIAIHEFGHWLAMKIFGYTGMGTFFIPYLGPVDLGRKLHAPAWQQLVVILAGPVPGILAGLVLLVAGFFVPTIPAWLLDAAGLSLAFNGFHLLPFLPLDGGKVVDLLLFRDLPIIRPFFTGFSAIAALVGSFLMKSRAMRYIALGMFGGLIWDIKMIRVVRGGRKLGWASQVDDGDEALRRIFTGIREEKNDTFLRSGDWFRQIDVLLAEVLRKRPRFMTRLFGGAFYGAMVLFPILLIGGGIMLVAVGGAASVGKQTAAVAEFVEKFPTSKKVLDPAKWERVESLVEATSAAILPPTDDIDIASLMAPTTAKERLELAAKASAVATISTEVDKLDWVSVGLVHQQAELDDRSLSVWLEILCGRMEAATKAGRHVDASRRAEVLLHAVTSIEPANTMAVRELLWDTEMRTLSCIEKTVASGKLDPATLQRIEGRINLLNKAPLPEVENVVLTTGWMGRQTANWFGEKGTTADKNASDGNSDWQFMYGRIRHFMANARAAESSTVLVARHWAKTRVVGELPAELPNAGAPAPGEAEYIASFCESHRRVQWRRITTLSAIRLEAYRQKSGKLPATWAHAIPGGAKLTLIQNNGPCLQLADQREGGEKTLPAWLGGGELGKERLDHLCPLHGAQVPELSRK